MPTPVVTVERFISAPAEKIFALLADPVRHADLDGSGTVRGTTTAHPSLIKGSEFGMNMQMGVRYQTKNRVTEFEQDRLIAWRTMAVPSLLQPFVAGRTWRYELEPVVGGTVVRESWDISTESPLTRPFIARLADKTRKNMTKTLDNLEALLT